MASHVIADRVADTSTTTGTSDFTVSGSAPTGYRTIGAVCATSDTFYYCISHQSASEWEVGIGTYSGSNVFVRSSVMASSNSNSAVSFSSGTKDVFVTLAAGGAARSTRVVTGAGDVTVAVTDDIIVVNKASGAATAVNLPASPVTGQSYVIKDGKGDAATNNITVTPASGNIDGSTTFVMDRNYQSCFVVYTGSEWSQISTTRASLGLDTSDSPQFTGVNIGHASDTTLARVSAGVASIEGATIGTLSTVQTWTAGQVGEVTSLSSLSNSIAIDLAASNNFSHTFTENTTLANPSNITAGQSGFITFTQHASSPKTLAFGSYWKFASGSAPSVTASNSAVDVLAYYVESSTRISAALVANMS